ncbi:MAG TPA: hypothetical protein GX500_08775 [Firmicutes bacterium]|nr:hypothetical protein [Candidatus Fermentithermobacillaceae bacterium]
MEDSPGRERPKPERRHRGLGIAAGFAFGAGFSLIGSTLAGYLIGSYLDRNRGSALFAPVGLLLGLLSGLHRMYVLMRRAAGNGNKGNRRK